MFRRFRRNKNKLTLEGLLSDVLVYKKVSEILHKANNLKQLGRDREAAESFREATTIATKHAKRERTKFQPLALLSLVYMEAGDYKRASSVLEKVLEPGTFKIPEEASTILQAELQKVNRELAVTNKRATDTTASFTQVYSCQNCGRLYNYVTMPCPNCDWYAPDKKTLALSIVLSNAYLKIPALLLLAREVAKGRDPTEIVVNANQNASECLSMSEEKTRLSKVLALLHENAEKNLRSLRMARECVNCGERVLMSQETECGRCGAEIEWPDSVRALACMDNLLWLLEQRIELDDRSQFAELTCLIVAMLNDLLRKQAPPSEDRRGYALHLLRNLESIADENRGAVVDVRNMDKLKIYLVQDKARDDSQTFGIFIHSELEHFVSLMKRGIGIT